MIVYTMRQGTDRMDYLDYHGPSRCHLYHKLLSRDLSLYSNINLGRLSWFGV